MKTIEQLRKEIDDIDAKIINLLDSRFDISLQVGVAKKASGGGVYDKSREEEIYTKIQNAAKHSYEIRNVYRQIMENSKNMQKDIQDI